MKKKNSKKSKTKIIAGFLTAALFFSGLYLLISYRKPDWIFLFRQQISLRFQSAEFEEVNKDTLRCISVPAADIFTDSEHYLMGTEMLLVNTDHSLPADFTADVGEYEDSNVYMDRTLMEPYQKLSQNIRENFDTPLYIRSSYRTREEQEKEKEEQPATAAVPGTSEHEAGLALDVYVPSYGGYGFLKSEAGQYVNENCWKYGFIIRYPFGEENSTGIPFEPWHLRYVGCPHAEIMYKNSWTLEEYLEHLEPGKFYKSGQYMISRQQGSTLEIPEDLTGVQISPDNLGFFIISGIRA